MNIISSLFAFFFFRSSHFICLFRFFSFFFLWFLRLSTNRQTDNWDRVTALIASSIDCIHRLRVHFEFFNSFSLSSCALHFLRLRSGSFMITFISPVSEMHPIKVNINKNRIQKNEMGSNTLSYKCGKTTIFNE